MAVGWIQFIDLKCIDRFRNDLIEIASIGTVLRRFSARRQRRSRRSRVLPQSRARHRTKGQAARAEPLSQRRRHSEDVGCRTADRQHTEREHDPQITLALALAITALASIPASPAAQLADREQLPGGPGIRPNLELGLRLIPHKSNGERA